MDLPVLYPEKYRQARNLERKKTKKMNKKNNNKGFTLAELLIVVAIIGVLVAIAIPTFSGQLEGSKQAADLANLRSSYSEAVANHLLNPSAVAKGSEFKMLNGSNKLDKVDLSNVPAEMNLKNDTVVKGTMYYQIAADGTVTLETKT